MKLVGSMLGDVDGNAPVRFWCAGTCGGHVEHRNDICAPCEAKQTLEIRANRLNGAIRSVPQRSWARFGNPELESILEAWPDKAVKTLREWRARKGPLCLMGPTGIGKTVAATALANRILDWALTAKLDVTPEQFAWAQGLHWTNAAKYVDALATIDSWQRDDSEARDAAREEVRRVQKATTLFLDEVGFLEFDGGRHQKAIGKLIHERDEKRAVCATVITTGCTEEELTKHYGDATKRKMCLGGIVNLHEVAKGER